MTQCEICEEMGTADCQRCYLGNPCIGCGDYDEASDTCKSDGGCGKAETVKIIDADAVVRALFDESEKSATSFIGMKKCIQVVKGMDAVTEEDAVSPVREDAVLEALHGLEEFDICFIPVYEMINTIEDLKKEAGQ